MKTSEELVQENKKLRAKLKKLQSDYNQLVESADRLALYMVGPHNAKALGLTNVKPMIINVGNKRIPC
ncbi:MAG: hypothetical protein ACRYFX_09420 [Janthinobacterium lividum]